MPPPDDLYDTDFFLWTQAQAEALRAAGQNRRGSNAVEWERVAEEVEDIGRAERNKAEPHLKNDTALILPRLVAARGTAWRLAFGNSQLPR